MLELAWTTASFILTHLLPGFVLVACPIFERSSGLNFGMILTRSYVLSFFVITLPGLLLARTHLLTQSTSILLVASELALFVAIVLKQRNKFRGLSGMKLSVSSIPFLVTFALILGFHLREILLSPALRGGFFYHSEVKYIIENAGIPDQVSHFGMSVIPQVDKLGYDILTAVYWLLGPGDPILASKVGYVFTVFLGSLAALEFFLLFLPYMLAAAATLLIYANLYLGSVVTIRSFFIPESLALICILLAWSSYFRRENEPVIAGLALGAALLQHLEIALLGTLFLSIAAVARVIETGEFALLKSLLRTAVVTGFAFFLGYLFLGTAPDFVTGAAKREVFEPYNGFDPTWEYMSLGSSHRPFHGGPFFNSLSDLLGAIIQEQGLLARNALGLMVLSVLFIVSSLMLVWSFAKSRVRCTPISAEVSFGVASFITLFFIVGLSWWCDQFFTVFIYQTEFVRRLSPYSSIFVLIILGATSSLLMRRGLWLRRGISLLVPLAAVGFYTASFPYSAPLKTPFRVTESGLSALQWFATAPIAPGETVLTNVVGNGAFHVLTDRIGLLEGHQPFLRPKLLADTLDVIYKAQAFFIAPREHSNFLAENSVSHVVFVEGGESDLGGSPLFPNREVVQLEEEATRGLLCLVVEFGGTIRVFKPCDR